MTRGHSLLSLYPVDVFTSADFHVLPLPLISCLQAVKSGLLKALSNANEQCCMSNLPEGAFPDGDNWGFSFIFL